MSGAEGCGSALAAVLWDRWPTWAGRPGLWSVYLLGMRGSYEPVAFAVVDDFGRLVRVPA